MTKKMTPQYKVEKYDDGFLIANVFFHKYSDAAAYQMHCWRNAYEAVIVDNWQNKFEEK